MHRRAPTPHIERTGRFQLVWEGRRLTVVDTLHPEMQIRAKVSEWQEVASAISRRSPAPSIPSGGPSSKR